MPIICQVQTLEHVQRAIDVGASVIVAQGTEAGGHGFDRQTTMTFTPEVADYLAAKSPDTLLLSDGGIADGRGLAAVLMLGADGWVLCETRSVLMSSPSYLDRRGTPRDPKDLQSHDCLH